jgi:hypothetical protein
MHRLVGSTAVFDGAASGRGLATPSLVAAEGHDPGSPDVTPLP